MAGKKLKLYFQQTEFTVVIYAGTQREEIIEGIKEILGVQSQLPLRFRDEDGDIVLISSAIPSGTILHVTVEEGTPLPPSPSPQIPPPVNEPEDSNPSPASNVSAPVEWRQWDLLTGGSISGNCFNAGDGDESHCQSWFVSTPPLPTSGIHYFEIKFESRPCCTVLGLISGFRGSIPMGHNIDNSDYPFLLGLKALGEGIVDLDKAGGVGSVSGGLTIGIYFNMEEKYVIFLDAQYKEDETKYVRLDDIPIPSKVVLQSPKHGIIATILSPNCPDNIKPGLSSRYSKKKNNNSNQ